MTRPTFPASAGAPQFSGFSAEFDLGLDVASQSFPFPVKTHDAPLPVVVAARWILRGDARSDVWQFYRANMAKRFTVDLTVPGMTDGAKVATFAAPPKWRPLGADSIEFDARLAIERPNNACPPARVNSFCLALSGDMAPCGVEVLLLSGDVQTTGRDGLRLSGDLGPSSALLLSGDLQTAGADALALVGDMQNSGADRLALSGDMA